MARVKKPRRELPQGWMGKKCRRWLRRTAKELPAGALVAEVGSWRGRSTLVLASKLPPGARLFAVDTWAGVPDDPSQHEALYADAGDVFGDFQANLSEWIRTGAVEPLRMTSIEGAAELARRFGPGSLDLVFIDADHRYEAVYADVLAYLPMVKAGGVIAGHDHGWPGVARAVGELLPGYETAPTSIWFYRVPGASS